MRTLLACILVLLPSSLMADGGIFRRQATHCVPHQVRQVQQEVVIAEQLVAVPQQFVYPQAAPVQIINNYPPANVNSVYGYPQQLQYNPFQVDPAEILREAARLTDRSQSLTSESLKVYQQLGTDAMGQAGLVAQLQARAALIDSTRPIVTQQSTTVISGGDTSLSSQRSVTEDETICLVPVGDGTYRLVRGGSQPSLQEEGGNEGLMVLRSRCASCHTGDSANAQFKMFESDGSVVAFTDTQKGKIMSSIRFNAMPPATNAAGESVPELTDVELAAIQLYLR